MSDLIGRQEQYSHFNWPEKERFSWQTAHPYVSKKERELLTDTAVIIGRYPGGRVLEVGCGEGANLKNLSVLISDKKVEFIGVDFCEKKIEFAGRNAPGAYLVADATELPFDSGFFDVVLVRDFVHHLGDDVLDKVLQQIRRVVKPDGELVIIESTARYNPIYRVFALVIKEERGMIRNTKTFIHDLLIRNKFAVIKFSYKEPSVLFRLIMHYKWGCPGFGLHGLLNVWEKLCSIIMPDFMNGYLYFEASPHCREQV